MKLEELKESIIPHIALYGPPGARKTSFVETWGSQVELIDCDPVGAGVGLRINDQWRSERLQTEVTICKDSNPKLPTAFTAVKQRLYALSDLCASGGFKKKVVVLDSLTALGNHAKRMVSANTLGLDKQPTQQHWGTIISEIEQCLSIMYSLPVATVVIGHDMAETTNNTVMKKIWIFGQKLPDQIPAFFNEIWYARPILGGGSATSYVLQTILTPDVVARSAGQLQNMYDMNKGLKDTLKQIGYKPAFE